MIKLNRLITKIDKFIHPIKYQQNHITKPIKQLCVGDKLYALKIPRLDAMATYDKTNAMEYVKLTTCEIYSITKHENRKDKKINAELIFHDRGIAESFIDGWSWLANMPEGVATSVVIKILSNSSQTFTFDFYDKTIIYTTDKNRIKQELKRFTCTIKKFIKNDIENRLKDRNKYYYYNIEKVSFEEMILASAQENIIKFKQIYNDILYKLTIL